MHFIYWKYFIYVPSEILYNHEKRKEWIYVGNKNGLSNKSYCKEKLNKHGIKAAEQLSPWGGGGGRGI